jgi:hypothetical protein
LWTTKEGIQAWWGPEGFQVDVVELDLRPDGRLHYTMTATAPAMVEYMKNAGMPLTNAAHCTYGEIGLPPACAACVNAYARATDTVHHRFPILEFV